MSSECEEIDEEHPDFSRFLDEVCKRVGEEVRRKAFSQGLPVVYMKDGKLVREYADGRMEEVQT